MIHFLLLCGYRYFNTEFEGKSIHALLLIVWLRHLSLTRFWRVRIGSLLQDIGFLWNNALF